MLGRPRPGGIAISSHEPGPYRRHATDVASENVIIEEIPGEGHPVNDLAEVHGLRRSGGVGAQECRQRQQPVMIRLSRRARYRPAAAWRDIGQILDPTGGGATAQIQAKAQLRQQAQLEEHITRAPLPKATVIRSGTIEQIKQGGEFDIEFRQRVTFRQGGVGQGARGTECQKTVPAVQQVTGAASAWVAGQPARCSARRARQVASTSVPGS